MATFCGCGDSEKSTSESFEIGQCGALDQRGSYNQPISEVSSRLRAQISGFVGAQESEVRRAVSVWSRLIQSDLGGTAIEIQSLGQGSSVQAPKSRSDCEFLEPNPQLVAVHGTVDEASWTSLGLGPQNPGVTIRCYKNRRLERQIILIQPNHAQSSQLMSVVLHELGHSLGLEHSCDDQERGQSNYINCSHLNSSHLYRQAVLFPFLRFGSSAASSEKKEEFNSNDHERARCLYGNR